MARQKLGGNEEYRTCCRIADAAIAVLENLGGREEVLHRASYELDRGPIICINPGAVLGLGRKNWGTAGEDAYAGKLAHWESSSI